MSGAYQPARIPTNEAQRLKGVKRAGVMDVDQRARFQVYVDAAKAIADCPVAYTGLLDEGRQYFMAQAFPASMAHLKEVARNDTLCQYALIETRPLVVPDLREHPFLKDNALVKGDPYWVFWAAFPLVTKDGLVLGTLCVVDTKVRELSQDTITLLEKLAENLTLVLELQSDQRDQLGQRMSAVMKTVQKEVQGISFDAAAGFLNVCTDQPASKAQLEAASDAGLVNIISPLASELTPLGRQIQSEHGLQSSTYRRAAPVMASHDLDAMFDLLED